MRTGRSGWRTGLVLAWLGLAAATLAACQAAEGAGAAGAAAPAAVSGGSFDSAALAGHHVHLVGHRRWCRSGHPSFCRENTVHAYVYFATDGRRLAYASRQESKGVVVEAGRTRGRYRDDDAIHTVDLSLRGRTLGLSYAYATNNGGVSTYDYVAVLNDGRSCTLRSFRESWTPGPGQVSMTFSNLRPVSCSIKPGRP